MPDDAVMQELLETVKRLEADVRGLQEQLPLARYLAERQEQQERVLEQAQGRRKSIRAKLV
jgi:hypothetical protein